MTRTVFANNRNFSHKGSSDKSLSSTPDVCKTPIGSATPPIPYPIMSKAADAAGYTSSVFIDGNPTAIASSTHKSCTGDEPGRAKGLISSTTSDKTSFLSYSFDVRCEGEGTVRHQDLTMMNSTNTMGAVFGMVTAPTIIEDDSEGGEEVGVFIDFYITDYESEERIDKAVVGEKIWLNLRTRNLISELVDIELEEQSVAFKYQGKHLIDNILKGYKVTKHHEKIELDVVMQVGDFSEAYFTDLFGNAIDEARPGDKILLNIQTENLIGEVAKISLEDNTAGFKYKGERLVGGVLNDYEIGKDLEKIELEVFGLESTAS